MNVLAAAHFDFPHWHLVGGDCPRTGSHTHATHARATHTRATHTRATHTHATHAHT
jgi:hypothetical protein